MEEAMEGEAALREWVRQHRVTWELGAWQELVDHRPTTVGFELRLFGQHGPHSDAMPGCQQCQSLYAKLRSIALAAFPKEKECPTRYEVEPFDASFHLRPESEWTPEVQLTVHIIHRDGYLRPLDDSEKRCADEIERALRQLGVQPKSWSDSRRVTRELV
jgi:hypothetical protein